MGCCANPLGGGTGPASVPPAYISKTSFNDVPFDTAGNEATYQILVGIAAELTLSDPSGRLALGADGVITYTGPNTRCSIVGGVTLEPQLVSVPAVPGFYGCVWAKNGDLLGQPASSGPDVGAQFARLAPGVTQDDQSFACNRTIELVSGDTMQLLGLVSNPSAGNGGPMNLEGLGTCVFFFD